MNQSITVAVGSPDDLWSSIWKLWVQGDEAYFGATHLMPALKVSLHKSGDWRIAWKKGARHNDAERDRIVLRWRRPPANNIGLTTGIVVLIDPYRPKDPFKNIAIPDSSITWLPRALYGKILALKVIVASKNADLDSKRFDSDERILTRFKKANGENVLLIAHNTLPPKRVLDDMMKMKAGVKLHVRKDQFDTVQIFDRTRTCVINAIGNVIEQAPAIYDLSVGWENVVPDSK